MLSLILTVSLGLAVTAFAEDSGKSGNQGKQDKPKAEQATAKQASASESRVAKDEIPLWPYEKTLIELTNAQRRRYGLSPLTVDKGLLRSARNHCYWMAGANSLQHTTAAVAENIAMGQPSCQAAVTDWMNSPGHRANMLGSYSRIGVAAYRASDGTIYWCVQFLR
jgi:uncharacterized protein YkwD